MVDRVETPAGEEKGRDLAWEQVRSEAIRDEEWQRNLTLWQSLRIYKKVCTSYFPLDTD